MNTRMRRFISILLGLFALLALCAICVIATLAVNRMGEDKAEVAPTVTPRHNELGFLYGEEVISELVEIQLDYLVFNDRVLRRYHYVEEDIQNTSLALNTLFAVLPEGVGKHLIMAPWQIAMMPDYQGYTDDIPAAIQELYDSIAEDVHCIDAYAALLARRDEYVFARLDEAWTARGAYYAARAYLTAQGIQMIPIEDYEEYYNDSYIGSLRKVSDDTEYGEEQLYFLLQGATNWQTVTKRVSSGVYETHESPTIALSRRQAIFIGSSITHSILHGDGNNGETLLVIGDGFGTILAPWLTPYYESIYFIRADNYRDELADFLYLFEEYDIKDCLVVEGVSSIVSNTANGNLLKRLGGN